MDAIRHAPHEDHPGGGPYDRTLSNIHIQPYPASFGPSLGPSTPSEARSPFCGKSWGTNHDMLPGLVHVGTAHRATTSLVPNLDVTGAYPAYLQGTNDDWQVEQLENRIHCDLWLTHMGTVKPQ